MATKADAIREAKRLGHKSPQSRVRKDAPTAERRAELSNAIKMRRTRIEEIDNELNMLKKSGDVWGMLLRRARDTVDTDGQLLAELRAEVERCERLRELTDERRQLREANSADGLKIIRNKYELATISGFRGVRFSHVIAAGDTWDEVIERLRR